MIIPLRTHLSHNLSHEKRFYAALYVFMQAPLKIRKDMKFQLERGKTIAIKKPGLLIQSEQGMVEALGIVFLRALAITAFEACTYIFIP